MRGPRIQWCCHPGLSLVEDDSFAWGYVSDIFFLVRLADSYSNCTLCVVLHKMNSSIRLNRRSFILLVYRTFWVSFLFWLGWSPLFFYLKLSLRSKLILLVAFVWDKLSRIWDILLLFVYFDRQLFLNHLYWSTWRFLVRLRQIFIKNFYIYSKQFETFYSFFW